MINARMGNKLKRMRTNKGLSRNDLANIFGITSGAIGMYEQGRRVPNDDIKKKYSMFFDETVDNIFFN
ncbi:helix-turn-helix transcriptional regulator [uncultured Anaerococcus sp.]|uniref:helix-turn-helix transcriptional regulator n=1 Tax=uncultured Anaerococcus sp. TaxID=293428 RepID=UPI0025F103B1|nr:helix-turn-helix transcriptional regulator [uncultured Anaerococcus sp.]